MYSEIRDECCDDNSHVYYVLYYMEISNVSRYMNITLNLLRSKQMSFTKILNSTYLKIDCCVQ